MPNKKLFYGLVGFVILVILGMYMFYGEQKKSDEQESVAMHLGEYIQGIPQSVYSADTALQILESEEFLNFANQRIFWGREKPRASFRFFLRV